MLLIILQHHDWYGIILNIYNNNASTNIRSLLDFFIFLKEITLRSCPPAVDGLGFVFFFRPATSVIFDLSSFLKLYYTIQTIQRFVRFSVWKSPCLCKRATTLSLSNWMFAIVFSPIDSTKEMKQMCDRLLVIMCLKIQFKCGSFPKLCVCRQHWFISRIRD